MLPRENSFVDSMVLNRWEKMLVNNPRTTVFQTPDWILPRDSNCDWFFANEDGIAPTYLRTRNGTRTIRLHGEDYEDFITRGGAEKSFREAAIGFFCQRSGWDICDFRALLPDSSILAGIDLSLEELRDPQLRKEIPLKFIYRLLKHDSYYRVLLPKTWQEFEHGLGKNLAYKLRAEPKRRLKQFGVDGLRMATQETFEADFEAFINLHTKRWQSKGQSGYFTKENEISALKTFCQSMLTRGQLRLYVVRFGDQPGGAMLAFQDVRRICFFSCGFDDEYRKHQPVKVLIGQGIQDGIKLGLEEFTFIKGKEAYKLDWANDEQQLFRLVIARKTVRGFIGLLALTFSANYRERRRSK